MGGLVAWLHDLRVGDWSSLLGGSAIGDNGLYAGQLQPVLVFLIALVAVKHFEAVEPANASGEPANEECRALFVWGLFFRSIGAIFAVAFGSLRGQIVGLSGARGLFPAARMLRMARADFPAPMRWLRFPACWLWLSCSDAALRATCDAGVVLGLWVGYGGAGSHLALLLCWVCWTVLGTACQLLQYPWDCLLSEAGFAAAVALRSPLPPLHQGLASATLPAAWADLTLRVLLARVILGMGKFKFSTGWAHSSNSLYLKHFMAWQPLPTPLAWHLYNRLPDDVWRFLHYAMWVAEVPLPALYFSRTLYLRLAAAWATVALQLGIQLTGNYGIFNVLSAVLALPLFAPDCARAAPAPSAPELVVCVMLLALGILSFPHNSYTTNAYLYLVPEA